MRISRIEINNFRSIRHLVVDLGETTVFLGPNNAGKTAILDALRISLMRPWDRRGTGFTEYDIHLPGDADDPKASPGASIEIRVQESVQGEWPERVVADLTDADIAQIDFDTGQRFATLRTRYAWNDESSAFRSSWEFLDAVREPLVGKGASGNSRDQFLRYLPVFYLSALRDVSDEYSPRSQFWGRLLKALEIPADLESHALQVLDQVNTRLLSADERLNEIAKTLSSTTRIAVRDRDGELGLRMVPLKMWDLVSKAEIILRNDPDSPWLPLLRQGQGIQSLSVIFLFQAFVEHLMRELYEQDSEPVLALEEPETHLHPQAARTLWTRIGALRGQKIVTTHSPYFVQNVPFRALRLVRLTEDGTQIRSLPEESCSASLPKLDGLDAAVEQSDGLLEHDHESETLTVNGTLNERTYRTLLRCCSQHERRVELEGVLRDLRDRSFLCIGDAELQSLETWAQRMRGEIFFAERWLIVEGQSEYLIVQALAHAMGYNFDSHGVSVIDAKNNGNPSTFAVLARAFGIPWLAVFDNDQAGNDYVTSITNRGFDQQDIDTRCRLHESGDLEQQLVASGLEPELREILMVLTGLDTVELPNDELISRLRDKKTGYAALLAARIREDARVAQRAPSAFRTAIEDLRGLD